MKIKKLISILSVVALVTMSFSAISVSAKTVTNNSTGTILKWDFESTNDFAPIDTNLNWWNNNNSDTIGSGAWSRQAAGIPPADNGPFQVPFNKIFTVYGNGTAAHPWGYIDTTSANEGFTSQTLENGGTYCAAVNSGTGTPGRAAAMCIMLSDTEFIPGQQYRITADLFSATLDRAVYVGLGKPSERPVATATNGITNPAWLMNGANRVMLSTATDPTNPKENGCADNTAWREGRGYITPTADMYEDGKILLYIGGADVGESHTQLPKNEFLYIDNIEIATTNTTAGYTALKRGRIWDFEEGNGSFTEFTGSFDASGNAIDVVNEWGAVVRGRNNSLARHPKYMTIEDANARLFGMWENDGLPAASENTGYAGAPAPGSNECVYVHAGNGKTNTYFNADSNASALGMRLVISQDEFPAGTYKLGFYGASTRNNTANMVTISAAETWKVAVIPTDHLGFNDMSSDAGTLTSSLNNAEVKLDTGVRNGSFWSYVNATITLTEACYYNGTTSIIIYNNAPNGSYTSEAVYFDDITLTPVDDAYAVSDGTAVKGYMTTVVSSNSENPTAYIATYAKNGDDVILTDVDSFKPASGVANHHFSIVPDAALGSPFIKTFLFDTNLKPLSNASLIGEE